MSRPDSSTYPAGSLFLFLVCVVLVMRISSLMGQVRDLRDQIDSCEESLDQLASDAMEGR